MVREGFVEEDKEYAVLISTRNDMIEAASLIILNQIHVSDIEFADYITDTIKIYSDEWNDASLFDYKTAQYIIAVQSDIIGAYNKVFGSNVTLSKLDTYNFLTVKFKIEEGCIQFICKISRKLFEKILGEKIEHYDNLTKNMTPAQKIATLLIIFGMIAVPAGVAVYQIGKNKELVDALVTSTAEINNIVAENQKTPKIVVSNIGSGTVSFNEGPPSNAEDIMESLLKKKKIEKVILPVYIDDDFIVIRYDFDEQKVFLAHALAAYPFWASTEWLPQDRRIKLKEIASSAIDNKTAISCFINVTCKIDDGQIKDAIVDGIEMPKRQGSVKLQDALKKKYIPKPQGLLQDLLDNTK